MNIVVHRFARPEMPPEQWVTLPPVAAGPRAIFINLSSGTQLLPLIEEPLTNIGFIRLQSTACEQKRWDFIIRDLDQNLLLKLAVGFQCEVYDCGARKSVPRAIWQGLAFVHYVLTRRWQHTRPAKVMVRGMNVAPYFEQEYRNLSHAALAKVDYYRYFYLLRDERIGGGINLVGVSCSTKLDGHQDLHAGLVLMRVPDQDATGAHVLDLPRKSGSG